MDGSTTFYICHYDSIDIGLERKTAKYIRHKMEGFILYPIKQKQ